MRVGYLVNQYPKVSHTFIRREILALEARGLEIDRFSIRDTTAELKDDDDRAEATRTRVLLPPDRRAAAASLSSALARCLASSPERFRQASTLALRFARRSERQAVHAAYLGEAAQLKLRCDERQVAHIHAHFGTNSATVAALCHALGGPPYSFTAHGPEEFDRPDLIALDDKIAGARFVVGVSSFGRSQLLRRTRAADWDKVRIVPCGVDDAFLSDRWLRPVQDVPRLCCVGRLCEQKGQLLLVEAAARVRDRLGAFELVLVGDGELRPDIEALVERHRLQDVVRITGWASGAAVREELLAARAMVLPSFAEGLPVVIMEALALERPVLSTFVAGIPELVDAGCGWLFPAGSVAPLVEAMVAALSAPLTELRDKGAEGRRRVVARHDARVAAALLADAFAGGGTTRS
ncbi:MAG: glycosyltransferase family 4 protein [Deltaproteobacteria bacterium]|nr:glycosyltransferase family 4 protein [Deltaproteobacteria bacterium]